MKNKEEEEEVVDFPDEDAHSFFLEVNRGDTLAIQEQAPAGEGGLDHVDENGHDSLARNDDVKATRSVDDLESMMEAQDLPEEPSGSILKKKDKVKVYSLEELDQRPYYDYEFQMAPEEWDRLMNIVICLRSDVQDEIANGLYELTKMLNYADQNAAFYDVIIGRTILELEDLHERTKDRLDTIDPEVQAMIDSCLAKEEQIAQTPLSAMKLDERNRKELICDHWDGYMDNVQHREYLLKQQKRVDSLKPRKIMIVLLIVCVVGTCMGGSLAIVVMSLYYVEFAPTSTQCTVYDYLVGILSLLIGLFMPALSLGLHFLSYKGFSGDPNFEPIQMGQPMRVFWLTFGGLGIFWRYIIAEIIVQSNVSEEEALWLAACKNRVESLGGGNALVFGLMFFIMLSLFVKWLPYQYHIAKPCCCHIVWVPSMSRYCTYGVCSLKCCKPLFRDLNSLEKYVANLNVDSGMLQEELLRRSDQGSSTIGNAMVGGSGNDQEGTKCCAGVGDIRERKRKAAVREYIHLQDVVKQAFNNKK